MKKILTLLILLAQLAILEAQSPFSLEWHGFVNPHYYADSRTVIGGRDFMMHFYPDSIRLDTEGNDLNDGWQANMLGITARLGLRIGGPDMLGAKTSAYIEGDFTGSTNAAINNLRLRHAYLSLDWEHHRLLVGQYWYAMTIHEIMPMTNPLNMGSPFHPYARYNQVRYEFRTGGLEAIAVAQWQLDNVSQGLLNGTPQSSTQFARHAMLPEFTAQLRYHSDNFLLGVATNLRTIQPLVPYVESPLQPSRLHSSLTYSIFGRYDFDGFTIKSQTLLNNSLYEGSTLGGYLMLSDGTFQDWHFNTVWADIERNAGHWRPGIFIGYAHNLDYGNSDYLHCFGRGHDLEYLWRVQPRLTYKTLKGLDFTVEAEYTMAGYSTPVGNLRLSLSAVYNF